MNEHVIWMFVATFVVLLPLLLFYLSARHQNRSREAHLARLPATRRARASRRHQEDSVLSKEGDGSEMSGLTKLERR